MTRSPLLLLGLLLASACKHGSEPAIAVPPRPAASAVVASDRPALAASHPRPLAYPEARREPIAESIFGTTVADPYRWLEDGTSDETRSWAMRQDALARRELDKLPGRDALAARLREVLYVDALGVPGHRGNRYFVTRKKAEDEKGIVYVREGKSGTDRVLLDPNTWSEDGSLSLGSTVASHDGRYMAYTVKANNSDEATLYVIDVVTGKKLDKDVIEGAKYASASWTPRGDGFYYVFVPTDPRIAPADRPGRTELRFHELGSDPKSDRVVRGPTNDAATFLSGWISWDGRFLFHQLSHGYARNQVFFKDLQQRNARWIELAPGADARYDVQAYKGQLIVTTDEGAPRGRVFRVDPRRPHRAAWQEIVPEAKEATLRSAAVRGGKLVMTYLESAVARLEIRSLDGTLEREVPLPGLGTVNGVYGLPDDDECWFSYSSFSDPWTSFELSPKTGKTTLYARVDVPFDGSPYDTRQVFYTSKDGTKVSMFIVQRKDGAKRRASRALLYGYGGSRGAETPKFNPAIIPWLERGGIYAVANLRGGAEYGEAWHRAGMLERKQNVFDDFLGAAEFLVREGYTDPSRLVISGASNGGLLVGAAMTQRPDLFAAVLCSVPLLDMVRYQRFGSGKTWVGEYGSPDDEKQFRALHAYSPYHHVADGTKYPPLLVLGADSDDRVDPMHARKFIAAVQHASTGGPALLRIEKNAGHGGADLRKAEVAEHADRLSFALAHTRP